MKKIYLDANAYANIISKPGDKELILQKKKKGAIAITRSLEFF